MWTWLLENPAKIAEWVRTGNWEDVVIDNAQQALPLVYNARQIRAYNYAELAWIAAEVTTQYAVIPAMLYGTKKGVQLLTDIYNKAYPAPMAPVPAPAAPATGWFGSITNGAKWVRDHTVNLLDDVPYVGAVAKKAKNMAGKVFEYGFILAISKWINENWFREAWDRNAPLGITFMRPFFEMCDGYIEPIFGSRDVNVQLRDYVPNFAGTIFSPIQTLTYKLRNAIYGQQMGNGLTRVDHERWYQHGQDYLIAFAQWAGKLFIEFERGCAGMFDYVKTPIQGLGNVMSWVRDLISPALTFLHLDEAFDNTIDAIGDWTKYLKDGVLAVPGAAWNGLLNFNSNWHGLPLASAVITMGLIYYNRQFIWAEIQHRLGRNTHNVNANLNVNVQGLPQPIAQQQPGAGVVVHNNMGGQQQHLVGQPAQVFVPHFAAAGAGGAPGQDAVPGVVHQHLVGAGAAPQ